ncbi:unnamed protein product (macronuclear) [Paramecium tetraurelia]|uniref:Uncharacterized protein n=1 Tax=Paramecium tetraurelia TaxID=5888 RepID=A0D7Y9_PARTE|nr:uncharacterized protein GSPATT00014123001 [Paramecium tetraurelia]CAK79156.1 unnamed protein product [Paramecium tetraurelia]|eukprot:XP_001446553.1 hypothetical protein (macronuclear) [Paramecium tetraurelia strain d4-2]
MTDFDVILVPTADAFHLLNFPITQMKEFESVYKIDKINYKPISTHIELLYANTTQGDQRLEERVKFNSQIINNRTYYALTKLDEHNKKIYLYIITNFQNMRVQTIKDIDVQAQPQQQQQSQQQQQQQQQQQLQKKYYKHYQEIKSKETTVELKLQNMNLENPKNIQSSKQMSSDEYMKYIFDS